LAWTIPRFLIFGLLTWTLAVGDYPLQFKKWPLAQHWIVGAATAIMLFVSALQSGDEVYQQN
jgi:hypothetical protein